MSCFSRQLRLAGGGGGELLFILRSNVKQAIIDKEHNAGVHNRAIDMKFAG